MPLEAKAVLFDAGGTLLLPTAPIPHVYLREAEGLGVPLEPDGFLAHLGKTWSRCRGTPSAQDQLGTSEQAERDMWRRLTAAVAAPFPALTAVHETWHERLVAWFDGPAAWAPAPGAKRLLDRLREDAVTTGIVSNWHGSLPGILEGLGWRDAFDFVITSASHGWRKPHPSIFAAALTTAGVDAGDALFIGDHPLEDADGARRAGIRAVLVTDAPPLHLPGEIRCGPTLSALWSPE